MYALQTIALLFACLGMLPKSEPESVNIFNRDTAPRLATGGGSSVRSDEARTLNPSKLDSWELIIKDNAGRPSTDDKDGPSYSHTIRQIPWTEPSTLQGLFNRAFTFLFRYFTIRMLIMFLLGTAIVIVSIVGMLAILLHSPGAV